MTINIADNSPRISYTVAQGQTQTSFAVPFEFFNNTDLNVYVDGTLKTITSHYTVSGGDGSTGTVSISVTGGTGGSTVVITRDIPLERTTDFPVSGSFNIVALNTELDRLVAIAADLEDQANRALQLTDFDAAVSLVLPEVDTRKGKTLAFNASTGAVEAGPSISDTQAVSAASADIALLADIQDGTTATNAITTAASNNANISTVAGISGNVTTVAGVASNVTTVAGIASNVTTVAGDTTHIQALGPVSANITTVAGAVNNVNTVATNIASVNTVATNITDVVAVAADLAETVSEIETVANDLNESTSEIDTVAQSIANVNAVGNNITNVNTVASNNSNINAVAADATDIGTVATNISNVNAVGGISSNVTTVAGIASDVTAVANIQSNISTIAQSAATTNINTVAADLNGSNTIGAVAGAITNVNNVGGSISNVNTVANNLSSVNSFSNQYVISANAPSSPNDGLLWFDTSTDTMKVYNGSSFQNAGSSVNGTTNRVNYVVGSSSGSYNGSTTSFPATYDAGYVDVYLNGVRLDPADYTATNGSTVVLGSAATAGDTLGVVGYGTFALSDHYNKTQSDARYAQLSGATFTGAIDMGSNNITTTGKILYSNLYSATSDLPSASTYHGMFAHVHATGAGYFAHGGNWLKLVNEDTSGNVVISGNLTVSGTTTTVNSTTLDVADKNITIANGAADAASADGAGLTVDGASATFTYANTGDKWTMNKPLDVTGAITSSAALNAASASLTGSVTATSADINGPLAIEEVKEKVTIDTTTSGTLTFNTQTQALIFLSANQSANRTIDFTNVNANMAVGESMTFAVLATQGSTAYYLNAYQVDSSSVTPKWQGGSAPSAGNASGIDAYSFTLIKTADATFTVLASVTQYA
jgi:hypothetical protein